MNLHLSGAVRPPVTLVDSEADMLSDLAWNARDRFPDVSLMLLDEIGRASLCPRDVLPDDIVAMESEVAYRDERSGTSRHVRLVYPNHADVTLGRISILTPVGAALIGLRTGASILWPDRDGEMRSITVEQVRQREAA